MGVDYDGTGPIDAIGNARITFAGTGTGIGGWVCSTSLEHAGEREHVVDPVWVERPVAMIATSSRTSSGWTSGVGLAIANTIAPGAIQRTGG